MSEPFCEGRTNCQRRKTMPTPRPLPLDNAADLSHRVRIRDREIRRKIP